MTALEIRIAAYGLAAFLVIGFSVWLGFHFTRAYYTDLIARDKAAQAQALSQAQQATIAAQNAQAAATQAAEKQYADLTEANRTLSSKLSDSVYQYTQIRRLLVPKTPSGAGQSPGPTPGTPSDRSVADASGRAAAACLQDAAELAALQRWAIGISQ